MRLLSYKAIYESVYILANEKYMRNAKLSTKKNRNTNFSFYNTFPIQIKKN